MIYCITGWGGVSKTHLLPLEVIQRKFLKVLLNKPPRYSSDLLYEESGVFDIRQLFYKSLVLYQYKERGDLLRSSHDYITRNRNKYITPFASKSIGQRSYKYLGPTVFNSLPENIQFPVSCSRLRSSIDKLMCSIPRKKFHEMFDRSN